VNEHSPVFTQNGNYTAFVDENVASGSTVTTVSASDGDQRSGSTSVQVLCANVLFSSAMGREVCR
jgi:hypothetical protein